MIQKERKGKEIEKVKKPYPALGDRQLFREADEAREKLYWEEKKKPMSEQNKMKTAARIKVGS